MKSVFLDCAIVNPGDLSWEAIESVSELKAYKDTEKNMICERLKGADAVFVDSLPIDREMMKECHDLKFIGVAATGFNHIELKAAKELGIAVANVPAYSTDAVAQHAVSLLLAVTNNVEAFNRKVAAGQWNSCKGNLEKAVPVTLLAGKSMGIIGYGNIGKKTAQIAEALGMTVNVYSRDKKEVMNSDVISLHCPLTPENKGMVNEDFIKEMKDGAILINTARGALLDEEAVAAALKSGKLAGAGLDVLAQEPPSEHNPLIGLPNCWITPHIAFTPKETRQRVVDICGANLESFIKGEKLNRLV